MVADATGPQEPAQRVDVQHERRSQRAQRRWQTAFSQLDQQHTSWQAAYDAYKDRAATWDSSYVKLETAKAQRVQDAAVKAAQVGSQAVLECLGQSADEAIRDARSLVVEELGIGKPDAGAAVSSVLEGKDFASLLAGGKVLNRGIGSAGAVSIAQPGSEVFDSARVMRAFAALENSESLRAPSESGDVTMQSIGAPPRSRERRSM